MKRREFLQGMGRGLLSTALMPDLFGHVLIRRLGGTERRSFLSFGSEGMARIVVAGIGQSGASAALILSQNVPDISCLQVTFDLAGNGSDLKNLLATVRSCDLLFLLTAFDDPACRPLFEAVGATALESGTLSVGVVPDGAILKLNEGVVSSLWPVSSQALSATPPEGVRKATTWDSWDLYAMRHLVATVANVILHHSLICVDFADVRCILSAGAKGGMGVGVAHVSSGAVASSLALERLIGQGFEIAHASGVLACVQSSSALTMDEFDVASKVIHGAVSDEAYIVVALLMDESMGGNMKVTILGATDG